MVAILLKLGHSREARKQCIKCFRLLKKELGVEPASEFKRLYQDLRLRKKDLRVKSMRSSSTNQ
ncbi:MAG: hypothetical protein HY537_09770 [Deltaproteobacteria bacterium]|nr:hypothetical protein [Deltaproteobacteria bacterium]